MLQFIKVSPDVSHKDNRFMGRGAGARGGERLRLKGRLLFKIKTNPGLWGHNMGRQVSSQRID